MISKYLDPFSGSSFSLNHSADQSFQGAKHQHLLAMGYYFPPWSTEDWTGARFSRKHINLSANKSLSAAGIASCGPGAGGRLSCGGGGVGESDSGMMVGGWWDDGGHHPLQQLPLPSALGGRCCWLNFPFSAPFPHHFHGSIPRCQHCSPGSALPTLPLCDNKKDSELLGFVISGNFPVDALNSQAGSESFRGTRGPELCISSTGALYSVLPWE